MNANSERNLKTNILFASLNQCCLGRAVGHRKASNAVIMMMAGVLIFCFGMTSSAVVLATDKSSETETMSEWRALSPGFAGRRRVPKNFNLNPTERRFADVDERLDKIRRLHKRLLRKQAQISNKSKFKKQSSNNLRKVKQQLKRLETQISRLSEQKNRLQRSNATWLRTNDEGLHSVSISDLATEMNRSANIIRRHARRGTLLLTNENRDSAWFYDQKSDQILFVAEAYDTFYSDENAYRLQLNSYGYVRQAKRGKRFWRSNSRHRTKIRNNGLDTPFPDTLKFEEEPDMFYMVATVPESAVDGDYWFWKYMLGNFKDSVDTDLSVPNPAATGTAQIRVTLRGFNDFLPGKDHEVYAELNGVRVGDSVVFDAFEEVVLIADFDQGLLDPSGDNMLRLHTVSQLGTYPGQFLDQIEIDYARLPIAENGELWLHGAASGMQKVRGFSSPDILVIESPAAGKTRLRQDIRIGPDAQGGYMVTFRAKGNVDYLVSERNIASAPYLDLDERSALQNRNNRADYLIVAPREFAGAARELANLRSNGFSQVKIAWIDDIYDEFSAGRESPFAVRDFMRFAIDNWRGSPRFVTLLGKGTVDQKDRMGYSDSFIPILMTHTPWTLAASDERLLGGDVPFAFGRIPITSNEEGLAYVEKIRTYESSIQGDEWYKAVVFADNRDAAGDFPANSNILASLLTGTFGFDSVNKFYHPNGNVRANMIDSATWEVGYVSYDGHGSASQAGNGSEKFITAADSMVLQNQTRPIFTALTCVAGNFFHPGAKSLASALVLNPNGGAIASLAPTGLSLDYDAQVLGKAFVDSLYGSNNTIGDAAKEAKTNSTGRITPFMRKIYSVVGDPAIYAR